MYNLLKNKLMRKILLAVIFFAGLASFSIAHAVTSNPLGISQNLGSQIPSSTLTQARCDKITKAIENRINTFEERRNFHIPAYENIKSRLEKMITKLEALGYDLTDIKSDVSTLNNKISKLKSDYTAFLNKLNEIKNYACDHTNSEVKIKLTEARTLLKNIKSSDDDIRNYIKNVIKQDILEIKNQKQSN